MDHTKDDQLNLDFDDITISLNNNTTTSITGGYTGIWDSTTYAFPNNHNTISISPSWPNTSPSWTITDSDLISPVNSGKLTLNGENADIEINGESVVGMLRDIRDRLNILQVSKEMEKEWDELRILREQYEAKLAECREKSKMWDTLKKMPPVEL
jgi:hypothetical protein